MHALQLKSQKPYRNALVIGRFQILHLGHQKLIDLAIKSCDRVIVFVSSPQDANTFRNPFDIETRLSMLRKVYDQGVILAPLPDFHPTNGSASTWWDHLINHATQHLNERPDVIVYGNDYLSNKANGIVEIVIDRKELPISASHGRLLMLKNKAKEWQAMHDPALHCMYEDLRQQLLKTQLLEC